MTREEAIKNIKLYLDGSNVALGNTIKEAFDTLIPELRENEDERIRKEIIEFINWAESRGSVRNDWHQKKCPGNWIAYLEKQKEQTTKIDACGFPIRDKGESACSYLERCLAPDMRNIWYEACAEIKERQKEQKPNYCHHEVDETGWTEEYRKAYYDGWNNCNMQHSQLKAVQKPAEWNEDIIRKAVKEVGLTQHQIDWFKINVFPPKQEWGEEDIYITNVLEYIVGKHRPDEIFKIGNKQGVSAYKICSWLNSLRSQPKVESTLLNENIIEAAIAFVEQNDHFSYWRGVDKNTVIKALHSLKPYWKPSEEQMEALKEASASWMNARMGNAKLLKSLYEQLKKLM